VKKTKPISDARRMQLTLLSAKLVNLANRGDENRVFVVHDWEKILLETEDNNRKTVYVPVHILASMVKRILRDMAANKHAIQTIFPEHDTEEPMEE